MAESIAVVSVDAKLAAIFSANIVIAQIIAGKVAVERPLDITGADLHFGKPVGVVTRWSSTAIVAVAAKDVAASDAAARRTWLSVLTVIATVEEISNNRRRRTLHLAWMITAYRLALNAAFSIYLNN